MEENQKASDAIDGGGNNTDQAGTGEPDWKQRYLSLQGMFKSEQQKAQALQQRVEEAQSQSATLEMIQGLREQVADLTDLMGDVRAGNTLDDEVEEESPKPRPREKARVRQQAKDLLSDHGISPSDARFADALFAPDPVKAVSRKLAEVQKGSKGLNEKQLAEEVAAKAKELHDQWLQEHSKELGSAGGGPTGSTGKFSRKDLQEYDVKGKTFAQMKEDAEAVLKQLGLA